MRSSAGGRRPSSTSEGVPLLREVLSQDSEAPEGLFGSRLPEKEEAIPGKEVDRELSEGGGLKLLPGGL